MKVEVTCPEPNVGDVLGDLNARRAQIEDVGFRGQQRVITGQGAAAPHVRLLDRPAQRDPGPRELLDAVRDLRRLGCRNQVMRAANVSKSSRLRLLPRYDAYVAFGDDFGSRRLGGWRFRHWHGK